MTVSQSVWEGIFSSFEEAGGDFDAFDTKRWLDHQKEKILAQLKAFKQFPSPAGVSKDYPLPLVVAMVLSTQDSARILDFGGGGVGFQYLDVLAKIPDALEKIDYVIVDGSATLAHVPEEIRKYPPLIFFETLEEAIGPFDVVHIGSTLQYIENWQGLLQTLVQRYQPQYFVFSDLLAGDIPTFVSHQIYYGKKIPHHFYNWEFFKNFMCHDLKAQLLFCSKFIHPILGQEEKFPNEGLPASHRIDRALNTVFYFP